MPSLPTVVQYGAASLAVSGTDLSQGDWVCAQWVFSRGRPSHCPPALLPCPVRAQLGDWSWQGLQLAARPAVAEAPIPHAVPSSVGVELTLLRGLRWEGGSHGGRAEAVQVSFGFSGTELRRYTNPIPF